MWLRSIVVILLLFIFSLLQANFFPYFAIAGAVPNLVFILFFITAFFEYKHAYALGFFTAVTGGFFLDLISPFYFGVSIASLIATYFLIKLAGLFLREGADKHPILYFIPTLSVAFTLYYGVVYALSRFSRVQSDFDITIFISLLYSLIFALIGFYIYKKLFMKGEETNQLKLL